MDLGSPWKLRHPVLHYCFFLFCFDISEGNEAKKSTTRHGTNSHWSGVSGQLVRYHLPCFWSPKKACLISLELLIQRRTHGDVYHVHHLRRLHVSQDPKRHPVPPGEPTQVPPGEQVRPEPPIFIPLMIIKHLNGPNYVKTPY